MKKFLLSLCSVVELVILAILLLVVPVLFPRTPVLFVWLIQSIIGFGFIYLVLKRAVRRRANGFSFSSFARRLRAELSLWSRKAGTAAANGLYCPGCGRQGTLSVAVSAFVVQGPRVGEERYAFEGEADHYTCAHCHAQFVNWSSPWPQLSGISTLLAFMGPCSSDPACWIVNVIAVRDAIALLNNRFSEEELIERVVAENAAVLDSRRDPLVLLSLLRKLSGESIQCSIRGASAVQALADLQGKMLPQSRHRLVGIPASAWTSLPS